MKSFRFVSFLFAAFALCGYAFSTFCATAADLVVSTARSVKNWVRDGFKLAAGEADGQGRPAVLLIQAKAFVVKLAQRKRPQVTASWRMCSST